VRHYYPRLSNRYTNHFFLKVSSLITTPKACSISWEPIVAINGLRFLIFKVLRGEKTGAIEL